MGCCPCFFAMIHSSNNLEISKKGAKIALCRQKVSILFGQFGEMLVLCRQFGGTLTTKNGGKRTPFWM